MANHLLSCLAERLGHLLTFGRTGWFASVFFFQ